MTQLLLAQDGRLDSAWRDVGAAFRGERPDPTHFAASVAPLVLLAIAIVLIVLMLRAWLANRNASAGPMPFFFVMLCRGGVSAVDRAILMRVARRAPLGHPAALLVSAALYDECVDKWLPRVPTASLRVWARRRLERVRGRLFSGGGAGS